MWNLVLRLHAIRIVLEEVNGNVRIKTFYLRSNRTDKSTESRRCYFQRQIERVIMRRCPNTKSKLQPDWPNGDDLTRT